MAHDLPVCYNHWSSLEKFFAEFRKHYFLLSQNGSVVAYCFREQFLLNTFSGVDLMQSVEQLQFIEENEHCV